MDPSTDGAEAPRVYHYTSAETLGLILGTGNLRLSPYAETRDPLENRQWHSSFSGEKPDPALDTTQLSAAIDRAVRRRAKIACLTLDRRHSDRHLDKMARGHARARMWEQYGDHHHGAVLVFDHTRLTEAMRTTLEPRGPFLRGSVRYSDDQWHRSTTLHFALEDVPDESVIPAVADRLVAENGQSLFFSKFEDWQTEREYRYVVVGDAPYEYVPIRDALVEIVLGMRFPDARLGDLARHLAALGAPELPVSRLLWEFATVWKIDVSL